MQELRAAAPTADALVAAAATLPRTARMPHASPAPRPERIGHCGHRGLVGVHGRLRAAAAAPSA